jgi:hypothetical protein
MHTTLQIREKALKTLFPRRGGLRTSLDMRTRQGKAMRAHFEKLLDALDHAPSPMEITTLKACAQQQVLLDGLAQRAIATGKMSASYPAVAGVMERNLRALGIHHGPVSHAKQIKPDAFDVRPTPMTLDEYVATLPPDDPIAADDDDESEPQ